MSMGPSFLLISFTSAFTSAVERASSFATVAFLSPLSFFTSTSVAITFAPSATNASAIARPIPCPAAVTSATLPLSLPANIRLLLRGVECRKSFDLPAVFIEVLRREPALERGLSRRPFRIDDRIPGGVTVLALHHLVLAEQALVLEAEAQRRALGRLVAIVALPLVAPVAERKSVVADQIHRLGRGAGALKRGRIGDPSDLEHNMRGADLHHPHVPLCIAVDDHGEGADVLVLYHRAEQRLVLGAFLRRMRRQIGPHVVRARQRGPEVGAVPRQVERLEPAVAALQHLALRERPRRPVRKIAHAPGAALSLVKNALSSPPFAASLKPVNVTCWAISFAMRMKPPQAERANAPPTLMRRTPIAARSEIECPNAAPLRKFTGFGATALHTASICSRVRMPGAYSTSAPAAE